MLQVRNTQNIHYKKCSICTSSTYTIGHHDRKRNVYTIDPHYFVRCQGNLVRNFLQHYYIKKDCSSFIDLVMKNSLYTCAVCAIVRESWTKVSCIKLSNCSGDYCYTMISKLCLSAKVYAQDNYFDF